MARIVDGEKMNLIGKNIRRLRKEKGMSQHELSVKLELFGVYVCRGSISRIEDESRSVTDIELFAFAEIFGVSPNELFEDKQA